MVLRNDFTTRPINWGSIVKRLIIGAGIGFFVIAWFVFGVDEPHPDWPANWRIRPLIVTPIAAAFGAAFSYVTDDLRREGGWKSFAAIVLSLFVFIVALWMGIVLGLDGTMWN